MKKLTALLAALSIAATPLYAHVRLPSSGAVPAGTAPSILEAAEIAASSGAYRAQNTANLTSGRIREDDKKRSAIVLALAGAAALTGAALWRWLPCRNALEGSSAEGLRPNEFTKHTKYRTCYTEDGERRGFETPTKLMLGAGIGLEIVSLVYLIAHLRSDEKSP
jgi:hypothetical protein